MMKKEADALATLLDEILILNPIENHSEYTSREQLLEIISNYTKNDKSMKNGAEQGYKCCGMADYITLELNNCFQLSNKDKNFNFNDTDKWVDIITTNNWDSEAYSAAIQIIINLANYSLINKQELGKIELLKTTVYNRLFKAECCNHTIRYQLTELYTLMLSTNCKPDDILSLYLNYNNEYLRKTLDSLATQISDPLSQNFLQFENSYKIFSTNSREREKFTFHLNIEFNDITSNRILTFGKGLYLEIRDGQFCISNDNFILALFEGYEFHPSVYYNITLTMNVDQMILYVDGVFVNSVTILRKSTKRSITFELGSMICSFKLYRLQFWNIALNEYSVRTILEAGAQLNTGINETWRFPNIASSYGEAFLEKLYHSANTNEISYPYFLQQISQLSSNNLLLDFSLRNIKKEALDTNFRIRSSNEDQNNEVIQFGNIYYYKGSNLVSIWMSINAMRLILTNLENCPDFDILFDSISHLLVLLRDTRLRSWFQIEFGFPMLAHILTTRVIPKFKRPLSIEFSNLFLEYCGWNFTDVASSLITNDVAYENLILNFNLWYFQSAQRKDLLPGVEIIRFLFFQLVSLIENSKFKTFNLKVLNRINILQRLSYHQHSLVTILPSDFTDLQPDLVNVYHVLLKENIDRGNLQYYIHFAYFELKCNHVETADTLLIAIDKIYIDALNEGNAKLIALFTASISVKFLMMILEEIVACKGDPTKGIKILLRYLLLNKSAKESFIANNGVDLLLSTMKKVDMIYCEPIIDILYGYSTGYEISDDPSLGIRSKSKKQHSSRIIEMKELLYLAISMLEWAILNDIKDSFQMDLNDYITDIVEKMIVLENNQDNYKVFDPRFSTVLLYLIDLLITMGKPQNSEIYMRAKEAVNELITNNVTKALSELRTSEFERYIEALLNFYNETGFIPSYYYTQKKNNYFDLAFIKFILPAIFERYIAIADVFPTLLSEKGCLFSNLTYIFNIYGNYLSVLELNANSYISWSKCLIMCLDSLFSKSHAHFKNLSRTEFIDVFRTQFFSFLYAISSRSIEWNSNLSNMFYNDILLNQEVLFKQSNRIFDLDSISLLFIFLGVQLEKNGPNVLVISCIRTVLLYNEKYLADIANFIDSANEKNIYEILAKLITMTDDEIQSNLSKNERLLFDKPQQERFRKFIMKNIKKGDMKPLDEDKLFEHILTIKENSDVYVNKKMMDASLSFQKENSALGKRVLQIYHKYLSNFTSDKEEEFFVNDNKLRHLKFQNKYTLTFLRNDETKYLWTLDITEDTDRRKRRLIPFHEIHDSDLSNENTNDVKNPTELKNLTRSVRSNSDLGSYDLLLDEETADLQSLARMDKNRNILKVLSKADSIKHICNCCLIVGLEVNEGILIVGRLHLYFVGNYYYSKDRQAIVKLTDVPEGKRDINSKLIRGSNNVKEDIVVNRDVYRWELSEMTFIIKKPFLLRDIAIEILFENKVNCFFSFNSSAPRDEVYHYLNKLPKNKNVDPIFFNALRDLKSNNSLIGSRNGISKLSLTSKVKNVLSSSSDLTEELEATKLWQRGLLSNFYYLIILNTLAGRTFNDLTQYPVFPWVIADYTSTELDLDDPKTFRDLSKPMGAQTEKRRNEFIERYKALEQLNDKFSPPFHYGTHYSSAMIVSSFLIRLKPFTKSFLLLQDGHISHPDRLFNSIERAWCSASSENTTDVRELVPEFFFLPEFLTNINNFDFGKGQDGQDVNDVILPPWAKNDPKIFITKNREALESAYVSRNLHKWIDLVFGCKQKGEKAVEAVNVFNRLSYPGTVNLEDIDDENEQRAVTGIIHNFGQTPLQIFEEPHPERKFEGKYTLDSNCWDRLSTKPAKIVPSKYNGSSNNSIRFIYQKSNTKSNPQYDGFPFLNIPNNSLNLSIKLQSPSSLTLDNLTWRNLHTCAITSFLSISKYIFLTGDENGLIKIWKLQNLANGNILVQLGSLYCHICEIKDMQLYPDLNSLLTLDSSGKVMLWDMMNYQPIRRFSSSASKIAISEKLGTVSIVTFKNELRIYNLNGDIYLSEQFEPHKKVSTVGFLNFRTNDMAYQKHIYWAEHEILLLGFSGGFIEIYELRLKNDSWGLNFLKDLRISDGIELTCLKACVRIQLEGYKILHKTESIKVEVVAGDSGGRLYLW